MEASMDEKLAPSQLKARYQKQATNRPDIQVSNRF
jgi:hypothetical protein